MIETSEILLRRNKLIDLVKEDSIVLLFSGVPKKFSEDEDFDFESNHNFKYLTNIEQEGSILLIKKENGIINETLYVLPYDPLVEKWTGKRLTIEEARKLSGVENILNTTQFESDFELAISSKIYKNIYLDLDSELKIKDNYLTTNLKDDIISHYGEFINVLDIYKLIASLRMVKSEAEVCEFKSAIKKTDLALQELMKNIAPGKKEYQMAALFNYFIKNYDNSKPSFATISSSGENACCLHYAEGAGELKDGGLILFDLGSKHNGYCADISRTYPVNGKFNDLERTIYQIVLDCNKMIIKSVKVGMTLRDLNNLAAEFLAEKCLKAKLIKTKEDIKNVYYHSVSHFIGLDTHDVSACLKNEELRHSDIPLKEGNVISDEPGLYFKEYGIGIRIEDDILVTKKGGYNLSESIIKEIKDIEEFMAKYNKNI